MTGLWKKSAIREIASANRIALCPQNQYNKFGLFTRNHTGV